jgi:hypothetical protein
MPHNVRDRLFNIRVSKAEMAMLRELGEHLGLTNSDTMRLLIRKAYRAEGLGQRRAKPKR